jgi:quinol monooxygenase YgiN
MELFIIARFHARPGHEGEVEETLLGNLAPTRAESGCLDIHAFRSTRDQRLYFIHSRWKDEAAFEAHAALPRMVRFVERLEALIDHPFDASRVEKIG